jgi:hypothetical protein
MWKGKADRQQRKPRKQQDQEAMVTESADGENCQKRLDDEGAGVHQVYQERTYNQGSLGVAPHSFD